MISRPFVFWRVGQEVEAMPVRKTALKLAIYERFPSQRAFLDSLADFNNGVQISEVRLSKIITGHYEPRPEEMRFIAWKLQKPIAELFGGEG
jgi:hypothetical protein